MTNIETIPNTSNTASLGDCTPDETSFALGELAAYLSSGPDQPMMGPWHDGQIQALAHELPQHGYGMKVTLDIFRNRIAPGLLRWNSARFMGYFATSAPLPSIVASALVASHNSNRMLRSASPAAPELDYVAAKWYGDFLKIPPHFEGQLYYGASQSHMHALAAALNRRTHGAFRQDGLGATGARFRIYKSELAHFFVEKNAIAVGIGLSNVVNVATNDAGEMLPDELVRCIQRDLRDGCLPLMVVATVGTTSLTSVDPVEAIADICEQHGLYLYVDAAYAGAFAALPEFAWLRRGWHRADAICINPHKQLMVPLGCSLLFVQDRNELRQTCQHRGAYIPQGANDEGEPMDFTFYCGMPVNSLAPIFNMLTFGTEGLRARLRRTVALAREFARLVENDRNFEVMMPPLFSTVCFRAKPEALRSTQAINRLNAWIGDTITARGDLFISRTVFAEKVILRLTVGNISSSENDIRYAYTRLRKTAETAGRLFSFRIVSSPEATSQSHRNKPCSLWTRVPWRLMAIRETGSSASLSSRLPSPL
jgi:aromatic-L-amino-acid/L-tryptophan decarboxylase